MSQSVAAWHKRRRPVPRTAIPDLRGAVVGGFAVGLIEAGGVRWFGAQYSNLIVFSVLIAVLSMRPQGLFGRRAVRMV